MTTEAMGRTEGKSPGALALRRLLRNRTAVIGGLVLAVLYGLALFGSFISPYQPAARDYKNANLPPTVPRFIDADGKFHMRPFVYGYKLVDPMAQRYEMDTSARYPVKFFVKGYSYKLWWIIPSETHLFGVDAPGKIALFGTDAVGKDVFSRVLQGGKVSLSIGLLGIAISVVIGMLVGGLAGYFGGIVDATLMRVVEFLLAVPGLYLIITLRAYFQTEGIFGLGGRELGSAEMYLIIVIILAFIGWASVARVIRGMVLAIKQEDFILAERALGAGTFRILARHILPNTMSYIIIYASTAVPGYILGEVALSYLGVGIQDPDVSWGIMLEQAQSVSTLRHQPWLMFAPASFIFFTVFAFNYLGDGLRDALDPKHAQR